MSKSAIQNCSNILGRELEIELSVDACEDLPLLMLGAKPPGSKCEHDGPATSNKFGLELGVELRVDTREDELPLTLTKSGRESESKSELLMIHKIKNVS